MMVKKYKCPVCGNIQNFILHEDFKLEYGDNLKCQKCDKFNPFEQWQEVTDNVCEMCDWACTYRGIADKIKNCYKFMPKNKQSTNYVNNDIEDPEWTIAKKCYSIYKQMQNEDKPINEEVDILKDIDPDHYKTAEIQPIEVMQMYLSKEQFIGFLQGNVIKYMLRAGKKGDAREDHGKLTRYAEWLFKASCGQKIDPKEGISGDKQ